MEDYKKKISGLLRNKKLRKDQCLILVLAGILLFVIALPVDNKEKTSFFSTKSDKTDNESDIVNRTTGTYEDAETGEAVSESCAEYAAYWEEKLERTLSYIEGAGSVKVMITLRESEGKVVEKDLTQEHSDTAESDSAGGSRAIEEGRTQESTIYTVDDRGADIPYVVRTTAPVVEGVVVITQGGDDLLVKQNIIDAIQVLFDMDANKITVVKMKNNNQ